MCLPRVCVRGLADTIVTARSNFLTRPICRIRSAITLHIQPRCRIQCVNGLWKPLEFCTFEVSYLCRASRPWLHSKGVMSPNVSYTLFKIFLFQGPSAQQKQTRFGADPQRCYAAFSANAWAPNFEFLTRLRNCDYYQRRQPCWSKTDRKKPKHFAGAGSAIRGFAGAGSLQK